MSREVKFRAWNPETKTLGKGVNISDLIYYDYRELAFNLSKWVWQQYTGLKDKNGVTYIYEGDIIDTDGNVIGNQYETPDLLEEKTNLLIQGFGTKTWCKTYKKAVGRGCNDSE